MAPAILDWESDVPTFALAFSPLFTGPSTLKLAIGSMVDTRGDAANSVTVVGVDPYSSDFDGEPNDGVGSPDDYGRNLARNGHGGYGGVSSPGTAAFTSLARAPHPYPPSAVAFSPARLSATLQTSNMGTSGDVTREIVASSSDCLRLWDLVSDENGAVGSPYGSGQSGFVGSAGRHYRGTGSMKMVQRAVLANSKTDYSAPLTSFSWSTLETTHIVTSSVDTTCTVWDIATVVPITQLIAHDREVYDVAWSPSSRDVFASVGADGSVRMFDLRSLEHSTILYEATGSSPAPSSSSSTAHKPVNNGGNTRSSTSPKPSSSSIGSTKTPASSLPSPLLRLAFSPMAPSYLSVCHAESPDVQILDARSPGTPALEVRGHKAAVNGVAWGGSTMQQSSGESNGPGWLATCSDDSTLLLWDLSSAAGSTATASSSSSSSSSRTVSQTPKIIKDPVLGYTAPSEINAVAWGGGNGEWVAAGCGKLVRCLRI